MKIAIVPIGYADGLNRGLSNKVGNVVLPLRGLVLVNTSDKSFSIIFCFGKTTSIRKS